MRTKLVALGVFLTALGVVSPGLGDWIEKDKLYPADGGAYGFFGASASIDGSYAVVGAPSSAPGGSGTPVTGAAYVYRREGESWVEDAQLLASDGVDLDAFGTSVSISGDYAIIGADSVPPFQWQIDSSGAAYVFHHEGDGTWVEQTKLTLDPGTWPDAWNNFGSTVSISGDVAAVGTIKDGLTVFTYKRSGSTWLPEAEIAAPAGVGAFAKPVCLEGDRMLVSGSTPDGTLYGSGAVYVYNHDGDGSWSMETMLVASDATAFDSFGYSIAMSGDRVIAGAEGIGVTSDGTFLQNVGGAYIYNRTGDGTWVEEAKLVASDGSKFDLAGRVAVGDGWALLGARGRDATHDGTTAYDQGAVYLYGLDASGTWVEERKYLASDGSASDGLGAFVAIDGPWAFLAATAGDGSAQNTGAVYVVLNAGPGDFDGDGFVGLGDYSLFSYHYGAEPGDPLWDAIYDLDNDDFIGLGDYSLFLDIYGDTYAYAAGAPDDGTVPEPLTTVLIPAALAALATRRRTLKRPAAPPSRPPICRPSRSTRLRRGGVRSSLTT